MKSAPACFAGPEAKERPAVPPACEAPREAVVAQGGADLPTYAPLSNVEEPLLIRAATGGNERAREPKEDGPEEYARRPK